MNRGPARKIKPSAVKNIFKFPSTKSHCASSSRNYKMVLVESMLEKDYCFHLEHDKDVLAYLPQPKTFILSSALIINREYTPDFEIHFIGGRKAYVEVKPEFRSLDDVYLHKLSTAEIEMQRAGYEFRFVDESMIRIEPLLSNLRRLQRYRDRFLNGADTVCALRKAVPHPRTLNDLVECALGIPAETILKLIANGWIIANLSENHLSLDSEVSYG